jgi:antirestriction protein ArdC
MRADLATKITDKLLELMAQHGTNWRQPWVGQGLQRNAVSKKPYRGINTVILATSGHASPFYATYKVMERAGRTGPQGREGDSYLLLEAVRNQGPGDRRGKADHALPVLFSLRRRPVDNAPELAIEKRAEIERHAECDRIIRDSGIDIRYGGDRAAYIPSQDYIAMPKPEQFDSREAFYSTTFHECAHATGAPPRPQPERPLRRSRLQFRGAHRGVRCGVRLPCDRHHARAPQGERPVSQRLDAWHARRQAGHRPGVSHAQRAADFIPKDEPAL